MDRFDGKKRQKRGTSNFPMKSNAEWQIADTPSMCYNERDNGTWTGLTALDADWAELERVGR